MKTQQDNPIRLVSLENLRAMCDRVSGTCHRYSIAKITRSRVHVEYSNPDEYGRENPMTAVYPCYPSGWPQDGAENPRVVLDLLRVINDYPDGEGWQNFEPITSCPQLWRDHQDGTWKTREEIEQARAGLGV